MTKQELIQILNTNQYNIQSIHIDNDPDDLVQTNKTIERITLTLIKNPNQENPELIQKLIQKLEQNTINIHENTITYNDHGKTSITCNWDINPDFINNIIQLYTIFDMVQ